MHAIFGMNGYVGGAGAALGAGAGAAEEMWVGPGGAVGADEAPEEATTPPRRRRRPPPTAEERARVPRAQRPGGARPARLRLARHGRRGVPRVGRRRDGAEGDAPPRECRRHLPPAAALAAPAAELGPSAMDVDAGAAPPPADERTMALNAEAAKRFITAALDT